MDVNSRPVADAGSNQAVSGGATVTLDGSASYDPDGDAISYRWVPASGIILQDATTSAPSFTAPSVLTDTVYQFLLIVSDGTASSIDTVDITVRAAPTQTQ